MLIEPMVPELNVRMNEKEDTKRANGLGEYATDKRGGGDKKKCCLHHKVKVNKRVW